MNTEQEIRDLAFSLMSQHNLIAQGWTFEFDRSKKTLGWCRHDEKKITMSKYTSITRSIDAVKNTILHECAHALLGRGYGHTTQWKQVARRIGCDAQRCGELLMSERPAGKYTATCKCQTYIFYRKITRSLRCRRCREVLNIVPTGL
jgi:predicted SprT family Zn-dependent metalloprotease